MQAAIDIGSNRVRCHVGVCHRSEQVTASDYGLLEGLVLRLAGGKAIDPHQPGRD